MLTKQEAFEIADKYLREEVEIQSGMDRDALEVAIVQDETLETSFGWVFFYTSAKFLETREFKYQLAGNTPIIVDKRDGSLHETGTAYPIEYYIDNYLKIHPGRWPGLLEAAFQAAEFGRAVHRLPRPFG